MPARIVVVHDDGAFLGLLSADLMAAGYEVAAFDDSLAAWDALEAAKKVELLITRIQFPTGKPHGVALARRALSIRPTVRILFTAMPDMQSYADDLGVFLAMPVSPTEVVETVNRMFADSILVP